MTNAEFAGEYAYEAWNHAAHARDLMEHARIHLADGELSEARARLVQVLEAGELMAMHARSAIAKIDEARAEDVKVSR